MIGNNVYHHPHVTVMTSGHQRFQILLGSKMRVYFKYVPSPVTMVTVVRIKHYRGDPDSIGAQAANVVQVLFNAFKRPSAVVPQTNALLGRHFSRRRKAIR